jgi:hypothetical protein
MISAVSPWFAKRGNRVALQRTVDVEFVLVLPGITDVDTSETFDCGRR